MKHYTRIEFVYFSSAFAKSNLIIANSGIKINHHAVIVKTCLMEAGLFLTSLLENGEFSLERSERLYNV